MRLSVNPKPWIGRPRRTEQQIEAQFHANYRKDGPTAPHMRSRCWVWTKGHDSDGYGIFDNGKLTKAHRVAWNYANPDDLAEPGKPIRHKCDNRECVRPSHLLKGTFAQNSADMVRRGRSFHPNGWQNKGR